MFSHLKNQCRPVFLANMSYSLTSLLERRFYGSDQSSRRFYGSDQSSRRFYGSKQSSTDGNNDDETVKMEQYYKQYMEIFKRSLPAYGNTSEKQFVDASRESSESLVVPSDQSSVSTILNVLSDRVVDESREPQKMLSHIDNKTGKAKMVDVGGKTDTRRVAVATGRVRLTKEAFRLVQENRMKKGDVLTVAQLAGIMATKQTSSLIPLCHNITIADADVQLILDEATCCVVVRCTVSAVGKTGVEMEALTGVAITTLTVYDMCKSVSHDIVIDDIKLVKKAGGKSGEYVLNS